MNCMFINSGDSVEFEKTGSMILHVAQLGLIYVLVTSCGHVETAAVPAPASTRGDSGLVAPSVESLLNLKLGAELDQLVRYVAHGVNVYEDWSYVVGRAVNPDGSSIDYSETPYADDWQEGLIDDLFLALIKQQSLTEYRLVKFSLGATDVPFVDWATELDLPMVLFKQR